MMLTRALVALSIATAMAGCATMPSVTAHYYFPEARTKLVVTQVLGCNLSGTLLVAATDAAPTTTYVANPAQAADIDLSKFGGQLKDSDVTLNFTPDGRLSGVNSTFTGEGSAIIKDVVTLASAVAAFGFDAVGAKTPNAADIKSDCTAITNFVAAKSGGDPKATNTVSLTYTITLVYGPDGQQIASDASDNPVGYATALSPSITLQADPNSDAIASALKLIAGKVLVKVESVRKPSAAITLPNDPDWVNGQAAPDGYRLLKLNRVAMVTLAVYGPDKDFSKSVPIWSGQIPVPLQAYYPLPISSGVVFGKQQFALSLSDAGAVTKIEYAANTGAPSVLEAAGSVAGAVPTAAKKASELQAQSDLIYQEQRLVICKTTSTCPGK